jgi:two-component system NtrC family sensor kinase
MSLKTVLVAGMLTVALVPAAIIGMVGVYYIDRSVSSEAQYRVNHDLDIVVTAYREELARLAHTLESVAVRAAVAADALSSLRRELDLTVLNLCDATGRPIAGSYPAPELTVPVGRDPVLRKALEGKTAWGTVLLDPDRLAQEGGEALANAVRIYDGSGYPVSRSALLWWIACPILEGGRVTGLLYGGRVINHNIDLVDKLRATVFSEKDYHGKPRGTVTIFMGDLRVATNVVTHGSRAIGTRVSDAVREEVLENGDNYTGEALVVDTWYLSAYTPLRDPGGRTIGMIYAGLLGTPYADMRADLIARFLLPVSVVGLLTAYAALTIVQRIVRPVRVLGQSAARVAAGDLEHPVTVPHTYAEIQQLAGAFADMREAVRRRDQELRSRNEDLSVANCNLEQSNRNYMQTLGFVTHELKAPLAAIQMLIATIVEGYCGTLSDKAADMLVRIQRNCEELQDMVRDYLDLSRVERGELVARPSTFDLRRAVVEPAVDQTAVFFRSRRIAVEVGCAEGLMVTADADLLRIALNNYLTNAAKYGREGGRAVVRVQSREGELVLTVRNDGEGFPPADAERLFEKFFRLKNANTHSKRGSGLGLFTVRAVAELHGGRAWADAAPGHWAAFHLSLPLKPSPATGAAPPADAQSAPPKAA